MLQRIARLAIAAPRRIIGFAVFVFIAAAVFGVRWLTACRPGVSKIRDRSRHGQSRC